MRDKASPRFPLHRAVAGVAWVVLGALTATGVAAQPRTCVRATMEEAFVLPDGSHPPAGLLRICLDRTLSPGAGLHTIVADQAASRYLSRRSGSSAARALLPVRRRPGSDLSAHRGPGSRHPQFREEHRGPGLRLLDLSCRLAERRSRPSLSRIP